MTKVDDPLSVMSVPNKCCFSPVPKDWINMLHVNSIYLGVHKCLICMLIYGSWCRHCSPDRALHMMVIMNLLDHIDQGNKVRLTY